MIELAPHHKHGLVLKSPILSATGILGYSDAYRRLVPLEILGAFITNPITAHPRRGASPPRALKVPGGLLMHTGLQNPGVAAVIRYHHQRWERSPVPVIAHVVGVSADEAVSCVRRLQNTGIIAGIELGLPDSLSSRDAFQLVLNVREVCSLPLIVKLPLWQAADPSDQSLAVRIANRGSADALTVAAPPRGTLKRGERTITGRLYGPTTFYQALWALRQVAARVGDAVSLLGCGGVHGIGDALAMLEAGAAAVQVDAYIWQDPAGFAQLAARWQNDVT